MYDHIRVRNVQENILKDKQRVLEEGTMFDPKAVKTSPNRLRQLIASTMVDTPSLVDVGQEIDLGP